LWPATLYGTLRRLMEEDLIAESDQRPAPELDDARRRYYRLTTLGGACWRGKRAMEDLVRVIHSKRGLAARKVEV